MTIYGDDKDKILDYIKDAQALGIEVRVPDVNLSQRDFSILDDKTILYGFDSVKGLPELAINSILEKRPFKSLHEIVESTQKREVSKAAVDRLTWSGALDTLHGADRNKTLEEFYRARGDTANANELPDTISKRELLDNEKDLLGIYLSAHPLDDFQEDIDWEEVKRTHERINTHGLIVGKRVIQTKHGDDMAFVDIEFKNEYVNGVMFPNVFSKEIVRRAGSKQTMLGHFLKEGIIVKVSAYFSEDHRGGLSFVVADMTIPVRVNTSKEEELLEIEETHGQAVVEKVESNIERPAPTIL